MKWHARTLLCCVLGILTLFILQLSKIKPKDYTKWATLVKESKSGERSQKNILISQQQRQNVSKEIYIQEEPRRYLRIEATASTLILSAQNDRMSVTEAFDGITALVQERCYYLDPEREEVPMQSIHLLKAKKAFFDYANRELVAHHVDIYSYSLPGHTPPLTLHGTPSMRATTDYITVHLKSTEPFLHSTSLKAFFSDTQRSIISPQMRYFLKEDRMLFVGSTDEPVYLYDMVQKTLLSAQNIEAFSLFKPGKEKITTTGDVHITVETNDTLEEVKKWFY